MNKRNVLTALTLAAVTAAAVSTAVFAQGMGERHEMGEGPRGMFDFATADTDQDGKITPEEFAAYRLAQVAGIDADGDGKLSVAEIAAQQMRGIQARAEKRAAQMIESHDVDGDRLLSIEELAAPPMGAKLLSRLDTDGDGAVSQAEFDAMQARMQGREGKHGRGHGDRNGHEPGGHKMGGHERGGYGNGHDGNHHGNMQGHGECGADGEGGNGHAEGDCPMMPQGN
jgi:hypothetical protein